MANREGKVRKILSIMNHRVTYFYFTHVCINPWNCRKYTKKAEAEAWKTEKAKAEAKAEAKVEANAKTKGRRRRRRRRVCRHMCLLTLLMNMIY